jgi:hypothetical protein
VIVETFFLVEKKRAMRTRNFQDLSRGQVICPEYGDMTAWWPASSADRRAALARHAAVRLLIVKAGSVNSVKGGSHNGNVLLAEIAEVSRAVTATSARLAKISAIAEALRSADPSEVAIVVAYLSGELPQRQIGVGWAALRNAPPPADTASLTVLGVDEAFTRIKSVAGKGSVAERKRLIGEVFSAATAQEQHFLVRLLSGELGQGALDGVMTEAVARAAEVPVGLVRRAVMLRGSLPAVAETALRGGPEALSEFGLRVGQPLKPMLAGSAPSVKEALAKVAGSSEGSEGLGDPSGSGDAGENSGAVAAAATGAAAAAAAVEWKLDGIRIQAHISDGDVRLFTRTLDDITARLPEVVAALAALPVKAAVFDGELIALRPDGRPLPFQDISARTASAAVDSAASNGAAATVPRATVPRATVPARPWSAGARWSFRCFSSTRCIWTAPTSSTSRTASGTPHSRASCLIGCSCPGS